MYQSKDKSGPLTPATNQTPRFIRIRSVLELTGLSKSYTYELCSKNLFPKSVQLVPGGTSVAWVASEVEDWIEDRITQRDLEAAQ